MATPTLPIDELIEKDRYEPKKILVVGDSMIDGWIHGHLEPSQDGVQKFIEESRTATPGGAANACRQLLRWHSGTSLFSLLPRNDLVFGGMAQYSSHCKGIPKKIRFLDASNRIVYRHDLEDPNYGLRDDELNGCRREAMEEIRKHPWDAVLLSDYDKGFLDQRTIHAIMDHCARCNIPCVIDAKRSQMFYRIREQGYSSHAVLKGNLAWAEKHCESKFAPTVITRGEKASWVYNTTLKNRIEESAPVRCLNHVGAGDCFAAHLTLALAHGIPLADAAAIAHAAGRVYVQHLHARPPWPHEIRKDLDPVGGKVLTAADAPRLRESLLASRMVFTNGVFRIGAHAGHAWLLRWARSQGDCLVVGVNADSSARRLRPDDFVLPLEDRCEILAGLGCVDWVIPFSMDTPESLLHSLKPEVLVKGSEYAGQQVPGDAIVGETLYAPESPFPAHASDLVAAVKEN